MGVADSSILIIGANGQLGRALQKVFPKAKAGDADRLDITNPSSLEAFDWSGIETIINVAAYTNVDGAETQEGGEAARAVNYLAVGYLAKLTSENAMTLVHISTAYVFDGKEKIYTESDEPNPLGVYAKTKLAGDKNAATTRKHYIVRTDSVIGDGKNFVRTMLGLADKKIAPTVVADQVIRPTFTSTLSNGIKYLLEKSPAYGIYNLTNEGDPVSWADFTRAIFKEVGVKLSVANTTLEKYSSSKPGIAPRPLNSVLDLSKIEAVGFKPKGWREDLTEYIKGESTI